jgi:hypothetical protein
MNTGVAKASCQDKNATINEQGYCVIDKETVKNGEGDGSVVTGDNESIVYNANPSSCVIKEGKSSCNVLFKWDLTNLAYNTRMTSKYIKIYETKGGGGGEQNNNERIF